MTLWVRQLHCTQDVCDSNPPVVTGICDLEKSGA